MITPSAFTSTAVCTVLRWMATVASKASRSSGVKRWETMPAPVRFKLSAFPVVIPKPAWTDAAQGGSLAISPAFP